MRELIQSSGILVLRQALTVAVNIVRTKVVAVIIGPAGMGVLAQAGQLRLFLEQIVSLGVGAGTTKYTADYFSQGRFDRLERLIGTITVLLLISGIAVALLASFFASRLAQWIFASEARYLYIILVVIALPLTAQASLVGFVLQGSLKFKAMLVSGVVSAVAGLLITIPLVILFGLDGAILSIMLSALAVMLVHQLVLQKTLIKPLGLKRGLQVPEADIFLKLARFGFVSLVVHTSTTLGELLIRTSVINFLGESANGYYQVAWGVSNQLFAIVVGALFAYGLPKLATTTDDLAASRKTYNNLLRVYFVSSVPIALIILALARWWIPLLYSGKFLAAASILPWQLAAQIALGFRVITNAALLAREHFRTLILLAVSQTVLQVVSYFLLVDRFDINAVPIALLASHFIMAFPSYLYVARKESLKLSSKIQRLTWSSSVVVTIWLVAYSYLELLWAIGSTFAILLAWSFINVQRKDLSDLIRVLANKPIE